MVKYYLTYKGIEGDVYLFEIYENGFEGEPVEIHGYVNHDYATRKDLVQPTVASSLDVSLEADENLTLQDLYTEEESKFKCSLKRNEHVIFYGILKPDGIWEDFVSNRWEISMDAMDGLSILKDLSFVKDDGTFYGGKITQFEALKQCLHRIGYDLPINISKDLPVYDGFVGASSILSAVQMNADRFYQDAQKNNIMDCEAVLKSILEPYSATVVQMNGEWWVFRAIDVKNEMHFHKYDGETVTDNIWNAELNIGSHIDQYEIFHCNANQKKSITASAQAFRVNYKYGTVKNTVTNPNLEVNPDLSSDGWIFNQLNDFVTAQPDGSGIMWSPNSQTDDLWIIELNQSVVLAKMESITLSLGVRTVCSDPMISIGISVYLATENFVYNYDRWEPKTDTIPLSSKGISTFGDSDMIVKFDFEQIPETSPIFLQIWVGSYPPDTVYDDVPYQVYFDSIEISPSESSKSIFKGEFHTAQRLTRISSVTKADKTVSVGDSLSDIYLGTLYKADGSPTEFWNGTIKPLLQLMVEDALRIAPRPMYFFEGDVFGYYPYLVNILINNVQGKYQVSKYSFDTRKNINKANFSEFDKVDLVQGTDYRYEFDYDYGNETKVLIKA